MAVLVFSWAYRAADGRRHDFTFLNQGTFFLKWGTFFLLFLTFPYFSLLSTKIKVVHTQGGTFLTFSILWKDRKRKEKEQPQKKKEQPQEEKNRKRTEKKDRGP